MPPKKKKPSKNVQEIYYPSVEVQSSIKKKRPKKRKNKPGEDEEVVAGYWVPAYTRKKVKK